MKTGYTSCTDCAYGSICKLTEEKKGQVVSCTRKQKPKTSERTRFSDGANKKSKQGKDGKAR